MALTEPIDLLPALRERLAYLPLGEFPTPVTLAEPLSHNLGVEVWIKNDGRSSSLYGGNKVRKLEFLLADAKTRQARRVVTFGGAGSNHAVACAAHGRRLGISCDVLAFDQPPLPEVRANILLATHFGATLHHVRGYAGAAAALPALWMSLRRRDGGQPPYLIPPGGSSPLGSVGYALAALELHAQIDSGALPPPDSLFVAAGSCGTIAGLLAGAAITGLDATMVAVRVVDKLVVNRMRIRRLAQRTLRLLARMGVRSAAGATLPAFELLDGFFGRAYGHPTQAGTHAIERAREEAALVLEPTYTGKTFAALLDWSANARNRGKRVLFVNTYNAVDFRGQVEQLDATSVPAPFARYLTATVAPSGQAPPDGGAASFPLARCVRRS